MSEMASQITGVSIVYSTVCSHADQRKHQSSASLAFVREIHRWPVNSPHKGPVTQIMFPFDDVICLAFNDMYTASKTRINHLPVVHSHSKYYPCWPGNHCNQCICRRGVRNMVAPITTFCLWSWLRSGCHSDGHIDRSVATWYAKCDISLPKQENLDLMVLLPKLFPEQNDFIFDWTTKNVFLNVSNFFDNSKLMVRSP